MPKLNRLEDMLEGVPQLALRTVESTLETHPQDRVHSGMFGQGEVVELLKNAEGYAYGHRIRFENGMEAELLITGVPTRH
jgi:hypothetical protein